MPIRHLLPNLNSEEEMLKEIGVKEISDLFSDIPEKAREEVEFWESEYEHQVFRELYELSKKNSSAFDMPMFLGGGARVHYVPSAVLEVISRSEFYSSYTPYQPEISQGVLQALFEYQSMMAELTGMEVVNCSMYDAATALGEAARMAYRLKKGEEMLIPEHISWEKKSVLKNYVWGLGIKVREVKYEREKGTLDLEDLKGKISDKTFAIYLEYPNFFGIVEEKVKEASEIAKEKGVILILGVDPIALGVIKPPSEFGADIVVGEGAYLGNPVGFGGPSLGIFATKKKYLMKTPGRLIGMGEDVEGRRAFLMILQAREQHIRRHRATSNICTNEALCAIASAVYMSLLGKNGLRKLAKLNIYLAKELAKRIDAIDGFKAPYFPGFHFNEFVVWSEEDPYEVHERLLSRGVHGGLILKDHFPELDRHALYATTEVHTERDYDRLISALGGRRNGIQTGEI